MKWFLRMLLLALGLLGSMTRGAPSSLMAGKSGLEGCPPFPSNNIWNARVDHLPVHSNSANYIASMGPTNAVHPDFGSGWWDGHPIGMSYTTVYSPAPSIAVSYHWYGSQSDPGPMPVPPDAPIEGGSWFTNTGDRHVMVVNTFDCKLYELYHAFSTGSGWDAGSGAVFDLTRNAPLRPDGWTSADAAGLSILPGLARHDEVAGGAIYHALRFTTNCTSGKIWPARHQASSGSCANPPPMGLRVRLKSSFAINPSWSQQTKVIVTALKQYGLVLADNGSRWYISGTHDPGWNDDALVPQLAQIKGSDFEVVDTSSLILDYNSWAAAVFRLLLPTLLR